MTKSLLPAILCTLACASAAAQDSPLLFGNFGGEPAGQIEIVGEVVPVGPGEVDLRIEVTLPPHNYIYSQTSPEGIPSSLKILSKGVTAVGKMKPNKAFKTVKESFGTMEKFYDSVVWKQRLKITNPGIVGGTSIAAELSGQYCNDDEGVCIPLDPPTLIEAVVPDSFVAAGSASQPAAAQGGSASEPAGADTTADQTDSAVAGASASAVLAPEFRGMDTPPIKFDVSLSPQEAQAGEYVDLTITATLVDPYHIYSTTLSEDVLGGTPTKINVTDLVGLDVVNRSFAADRKPESKVVAGDVLEYFHDSVTWTRQYMISEQADASAAVGLAGNIEFQICTDRGCLNPTVVDFQLALRGTPEMAVAGSAGDDDPTAIAEGSRNSALLPFIIAAVGYGFIALLTPCVFPMIPVTISFFMKQGEEKPGGVMRLAIIYCLGIVGAFTLLGVVGAAVFGPTSLNTFANNRWLNLAFAAIFTVFGLMLMGMFELRIPSWMLTWSSKKQEAGGVVGVLFMALTFTLVSFTCTFAFVGQLLVWAAQGDYTMPIIGMLAFSSAFASPFFFLAMFPSLLKKMPKSGGWMNTVKVTMGLIELAVVVKFLSVADTGFSPDGQPMFLDYHLVMGGWIAIAMITGLYLLGVFRMPHDSPTESIGPARCMFSLGFVGLAAYIAVGLFSPKQPEGVLWKQIVAFAPPQLETDGLFINHDGLQYSLDYDAATEVATTSNKPMFLDFTGVNCINCRLMEQDVLSRADVHLVLEDLVRVQLYVDHIPGVSKASDDHNRLLERNKSLQSDWFGDVSIPAYVIATPDGQVLAMYKGLDKTGEEFPKFLEAGLKRWQTLGQEQQAATAQSSSVQQASFQPASLSH